MVCPVDPVDPRRRPGGRADALKFALGANAVHGHRRTNADKRRCVEIALREFPKLSSRAVAKVCGVSPGFVDHLREPQLPTVGSSPATRTGLDGKERPATYRREERSGDLPRRSPEMAVPGLWYRDRSRADPSASRSGAPRVTRPPRAPGRRTKRGREHAEACEAPALE